MTSKKKNTEAMANRLRLAREQAGLSQAEVAKLLKLHQPSLSQIETGVRRVSVEELEQMAKLYKVPMAWLACADIEEVDRQRDQRDMAALMLVNMTTEELDKVLGLLTTIRQQRVNSK